MFWRNGRSVTIYSGRTEKSSTQYLKPLHVKQVLTFKYVGRSIDLALLLNEEGSKTQADVFLSRSPGPVGYLESKDYLAKSGKMFFR